MSKGDCSHETIKVNNIMKQNPQGLSMLIISWLHLRQNKSLRAFKDDRKTQLTTIIMLKVVLKRGGEHGSPLCKLHKWWKVNCKTSTSTFLYSFRILLTEDPAV